MVALSPAFVAALDRDHAYLMRRAGFTSSAAARSALPNSGTRRRQVYDFIAKLGERGATDAEIIVGCNMPHQSVGPRRLELLEAGLIKDSGKRRLTPTGNPAVVWVLANDNNKPMRETT